jgi:ribosomal protein S17E
MGRIKSTLIKRTSKQLLHQKEMFNEDFNHNKKILGNTMPSKKTRNKIAGYIAHLVKMQRLQAIAEEKRKAKAAHDLAQAIQAGE